MRLVIQRVTQATVTVHGQAVASIGPGLLVLAGICKDDTQQDIQWLVSKLLQLRIFSDDDGLMNLSIRQTDGEVLLVSQFTLYASTRKGNRPSFIHAAPPHLSQPIYDALVAELGKQFKPQQVQSGLFGQHMVVSLDNDGPVTIMIDSKFRE